jgi:hypothetical protein
MIGMLRLLAVFSAIWIVGCGGSNAGVEAPQNPTPPPDVKPQNTGMQPATPASVD